MRCSTLKTLPDDEQIFDYDCEDAGEFIINMRGDDPADYQEFLDAMQPQFGEPLRQPSFKLIEHLCHYVMRTMAAVVASQDSRKAVKDMNKMTLENAKLFKKNARISRL